MRGRSRRSAHDVTPAVRCFRECRTDRSRFHIDLFRAVFGTAEEVGRTVFSEAEIETLKRLHGPPQEHLPGPAETVTTIRFHLNGSELLALNGGAYFGQFHETFSLYVQCQTQAQIDRLHAPLSDGGQRQDPIDHHLFGRLDARCPGLAAQQALAPLPRRSVPASARRRHRSCRPADAHPSGGRLQVGARTHPPLPCRPGRRPRRPPGRGWRAAARQVVLRPPPSRNQSSG
ncbi:3-demethylubiquinone-9 3-methyltransferase [Tepidamorphus gemmatus]|uniref:3-demethylubiquinone-9 3-methyltransferase n=1 Tax=Tepidamorphus gemmatus TaxID=747076 RepID=A0A4R3LTD4_9HYPH|nr:3-demethylubiquinone-9 3-methyltransferase [Tepidamorphus gemmatus]